MRDLRDTFLKPDDLEFAEQLQSDDDQPSKALVVGICLGVGVVIAGAGSILWGVQ